MEVDKGFSSYSKKKASSKRSKVQAVMMLQYSYNLKGKLLLLKEVQEKLIESGKKLIL